MKYYLIAGEASGDLHGSNLMKELKKIDPQAEFRFLGGDLMQEAGGTLVLHYKKMAFMGFIAVIKNLKTVLQNLSFCKKDIQQYQPDVVILIDYPSFNLKIAKFAKKQLHNTPVFYYISPKIWAWKEYRIKDIKKYVDHIFSILPFEVDYFKKHEYQITYVGNPSVDAIENRKEKEQTFTQFITQHYLSQKPIVAILAGSRKQEIKHCLPTMLDVATDFPEYQFVVAGAPGIDLDFYNKVMGEKYQHKVVFGETYALLQHAKAALINSGTASLEGALLKVPQVVGYHIFGGKIARRIFENIIKVKWASLVNLIANKLVVKEFLADEMTTQNLSNELKNILTDENYRHTMLENYAFVKQILGEKGASEKAACEIYKKLTYKDD